MIVEIIYSFKGGTGKTTISLAKARLIAPSGFRILLIDLDPQTNLSQTLQYVAKKNLYNVLMDDCSLLEAATQTHIKNLDIVAGDIRVAKIFGSVRENMFISSINELRQKNAYDFVIFDCLPTFSNLHQAALKCSDLLTIPSKVSGLDIAKIEFVVTEAAKINPEIDCRILLNETKNFSGELTVEEREYFETDSGYLREDLIELIMKTKVQKNGSFKQVIDRDESLDLKTHKRLRENIRLLVEESYNIKIK